MIIALAMLFILSPAASAHTDLVSTDPAEGAVLASPPEEIALTFTDRMSGEFDTVNLTVASNDPIPLRTSADGNLVRARVPTMKLTDIKAQGTVDWRLVYRVVSADGHPVEGVVSFRAPLPATPKPSASDTAEAETPTESAPDLSTTQPPEGATSSEPSTGASEDAVPDRRPSSSDDESGGSSPTSSFFVIAGVAIAATVGFVVFAVRRRARDRSSDA